LHTWLYMAGPTRTAAQREHDYTVAARLHLRGKEQIEIAEILGISQAQVSRDLKVIEGRWQEAARADIGELKARELARLESLRQELLDAWERSKERGEEEPRYLQQLREISKSIRDLLGLDTPQRHEFSGADGAPLVLTFVPAEKSGDAGA
jgi:predicted transcriptional regulator